MSYSLFVPQVRKPEVRRRIAAAAEEEFAAHGYRGAKMAAVARRAGVSAGNLYRYFASKESLFEAVIDAEFVARFEALLDQRVYALAGTDLREPPARTRRAAASMLEFWIAHRLRVVILLDRCAGSRWAAFGEAFVERLVDLALAQLRTQAEAGELDEELARFTLGNVFRGARRSIVAILESYADEAEIHAAFTAFWSFQLAGLAGLEGWARDQAS